MSKDTILFILLNHHFKIGLPLEFINASYIFFIMRINLHLYWSSFVLYLSLSDSLRIISDKLIFFENEIRSIVYKSVFIYILV